MRTSTVGNVLVVAGAFVGVIAIAAVSTDYSPSLSREMVALLFYKGLGAAAVGLMLVGTWVARGGRRKERKLWQPRDNAERPGEDAADARLLTDRRPDSEIDGPIDPRELLVERIDSRNETR